MKQILAGFLFTIISTGSSFAQNNDTIRLIGHPEELLQIENSLKPNKEENALFPLTPDHANSRKRPHSYIDKQKVFRLNSDRPKTTVFNAPYSKFIIPAALVSYGALSGNYEWMRKIDRSTRNEVNEHFSKRIRLDDYVQFVPNIAVLGVDALGIKAKHRFGDRAFVLGASHLLVFTSVQTVKRKTAVVRPDGSNNRSFPSGHTATAFVGAHALFRECRETAPWLCFAGYAMACGTGAMRVYNDKHWVSDVVAGAGIGMLSVELSYLLLPVFHSIIGKKETKNNLVMLPVAGNRSYGVGLSCSF